MQPVIVPATEAHAIAMAPHVRLNDALEVRRVTALPPERVLLTSLDLSAVAWTWLMDDQPACMFGIVACAIDDEAQPWMLGTEAVRRNPKLFWKHSRAIVRLMAQQYPRLSGHCDARYDATVRWLTRLGFMLEGPYPMPPFNFHFYRFTMGH